MPGKPHSGKPRTTKARAQRIDRQYFLRSFAIQRWRWILSAIAIGLSLVWLGFHMAARDNTVYTAGTLTPGHAILNRRCSVCHAGAGGFTAKVADRSCSACHSGAIHQASQTFTPRCIDCHREHTGGALPEIGDAQCTACHADLRVKTGDPKAPVHIHSFTADHPEFSTRSGVTKDPGAIRFNHSVHLKKGLRSIEGHVTLVCSDCHRAGNGEPWPWGASDPAAALAQDKPSPDKRLMEPVNYYEHCSKCHPLTFDARFSDAAPHKDPAVVHDFLTQKFAVWVAAHPEELRPASSAPRIPGLPRPQARNQAAWITTQVDQAERLLRVKTCRECHALPSADQGIPPVPKTQIRTRWLPHSTFDHSAHQMLVCEACHNNARKSEKTSDVLIPGIAVCRDCHIPGRQDAARANCAECHLYHDPAQRKTFQGRLTLDEVSADR